MAGDGSDMGTVFIRSSYGLSCGPVMVRLVSVRHRTVRSSSCAEGSGLVNTFKGVSTWCFESPSTFPNLDCLDSGNCKMMNFESDSSFSAVGMSHFLVPHPIISLCSSRRSCHKRTLNRTSVHWLLVLS